MIVSGEQVSGSKLQLFCTQGLDFWFQGSRPELYYINNGWKALSVGFDNLLNKIFALVKDMALKTSILWESAIRFNFNTADDTMLWKKPIKRHRISYFIFTNVRQGRQVGSCNLTVFQSHATLLM